MRTVNVGPVRITGPSGLVRGDAATLSALDGRIDNGEDLARELGVDGASDDGLLALRAYQRWGFDAAARFRGTFAHAFWDGRADRLFLTSDPVGLRILYHTRVDGGLAFATSLRALLALPGVSRDLDEGYLAAFLTDVVPEPDATFYAAIRRVPSACTAVVDRDGAMTVREYWRPDWGRRIRYRRDDEYVEHARALLDQAVGRALRGLDPVVCHLSGGLDSSGVAATAARLRAPATVHALTAAPADGVPRVDLPLLMTDERPGAAAVARIHPNMAWEAISSPTLHRFDEDPRRLFLALGMPMRNVLNIGWFAPLHDRARELGGRAILTGAFGNLTLSWDGLPGLATMARSGRWIRMWREAAALGRARDLSTARVLLRHVAKPLLPPGVQRWVDDRRGKPRPASERGSAIHPEFARATAVNERRLESGNDYPCDTDRFRRLWFVRSQRLPGVSRWIGELQGLDVRDPTADRDLLEFCFAVPDEQYLRGGTTRWLARRVLADRLPPEVLNETRLGMQCPEFMHRITLQRDAIMENLEALERSPLASRVLDVARMKRLAADWPTDISTATFTDYGNTLHRGLHIGRFIRWLEGGNE